jgi:O-antigen ligase
MWGASLLTSARSFLRIIHFIIGVFAFEALLAGWQFVAGPGDALYPHGTFATNQKFSEFMGFGAAMCYALFCSSTRKLPRQAYFVLMLLLLGGAILGQERAPWLAFLISGTLISFLAAEGKRRKKLVVQFLATVLAIVITVASIPAVREKVVTRFAEAQLEEVGQNTLLSRLAVWGVAWQLFLTHPVLGVGPKNFTTIVPSYLTFVEMGHLETADPHNVWIGILAEGGVVGFLTYVPLCISILVLAYSKLRDPAWQPVRPLLLAYLAYHFFSFAMSYHYFVKAEGHFHFLMIGLMLGLHRGIREGPPLLPAANDRP